MNNTIFKILVAVASAIAGGFSGTASAHTLTSTIGSTSFGWWRSDVHVINCYDDGNGAPYRLVASIKDNVGGATPPLLYLQMFKGGGLSAELFDPVDGDDNFSNEITLYRGGGDYYVFVNKSASTNFVIESYTLEYHCLAGNGAHTGTAYLFQSQNQ